MPLETDKQGGFEMSSTSPSSTTAGRKPDMTPALWIEVL